MPRPKLCKNCYYSSKMIDLENSAIGNILYIMDCVFEQDHQRIDLEQKACKNFESKRKKYYPWSEEKLLKFVEAIRNT